MVELVQLGRRLVQLLGQVGTVVQAVDEGARVVYGTAATAQATTHAGQSGQLGRIVQGHLETFALGAPVLEPELDVLALQAGELLAEMIEREGEECSVR